MYSPLKKDVWCFSIAHTSKNQLSPSAMCSYPPCPTSFQSLVTHKVGFVSPLFLLPHTKMSALLRSYLCLSKHHAFLWGCRKPPCFKSVLTLPPGKIMPSFERPTPFLTLMGVITLWFISEVFLLIVFSSHEFWASAIKKKSHNNLYNPYNSLANIKSSEISVNWMEAFNEGFQLGRIIP